MHRGYIKIWRKVKDSGLYQLPNAFTLFVYMLTEATHKPIRYGAVELERGQLVTGRHKLSYDLGMSERTVRTAIDHLTKLDFIASKSTNKYTIYTIVNYGKYQDVGVEIDQQNDQQATSKRPTSDQQTTTIQEHKNKRTKEIPATADNMFSDVSDRQLVKDWLAVRKLKKLPVTETAINGFMREVNKSGWSTTDVLRKCCEKSWGGFEAKWIANEQNPSAKFNLQEFMKDK